MAELINKSYDVVIVGSGAAGSSLAARLASAGKRVLILEAGPARVMSDLVSSPMWARRLKWGGSPVREVGRTPIAHAFNAGYGTGGSALHHYAVWPRLHPEDFRMHSQFSRGLDWPITYEDLRPHYDAVQSEIGISGDSVREIWRPPGEPYPLPPVPLFPQGEAVQRGFTRLGRTTAPVPLAILTEPYRGRAACIWDGWCDAGCPIGALANPLTIHLPDAIRDGATLVNRATVLRVLTTPDGAHATGVEFADADGKHTIVEGGIVALAAFSVENPRLLLASATPVHRHGLANSSNLVGRYLMAHGAALIYGLFDTPTLPHMGASGGQLLNQDHYAKLTHKDRQAFGSYQWLIAQAAKPTDLLGISSSRADLFGERLDAFMRRAARGFAMMGAVVEDLPVADNRVDLVAERDKYGVPLAQVTHNADPASESLLGAALDDGKQVFHEAGAGEVWAGPRGSMHIMGGTIMGKDPGHSVTDSYGQTHDVRNLFIAGPGLFPTSGGVNPTFTVHALARRTAAHIQKNFSRLTA